MQIEPGTLADLDCVRPASTSASAPSPVETFPAISSTSWMRLDLPDDVEHSVGVAVRRVHDEDVHLGVDERRSPLERVRPDPDRRAHAQAALVVLRRVGVLDLLRDVLDGDEALEPSVGVDDRELLDLVAMEDRLGLLERRADRRGDEVAARHERRDGLRGVGLEAEVAVREDADEDTVVVRDRDARDPVALHELERLRDGVSGLERDGLDDHPGLRALHLVHLGDLILDGEVTVDDAEPARAGERDREPRLRHRVHGRRDERDVQRDRRRQPRDRRDVVRQHVRLGREQEDVVEREPLLAELPLERDEPLDLAMTKLGVHGATLAAPGDGDHETSTPAAVSHSRSRAASATSPFLSAIDSEFDACSRASTGLLVSAKISDRCSWA